MERRVAQGRWPDPSADRSPVAAEASAWWVGIGGAIGFGLLALFAYSETPAALGNGLPLCVEPGAARGLFDEDCPLALPRDTGMSILLTSPAWLLAVPALRALYGRSRLVTGAAIAVILVFVVNLMHFSQGWVQFGYRFSNDFLPFALPLVALGAERLRMRPIVIVGLLGASIAVNAWGTLWGAKLGW